MPARFYEIISASDNLRCVLCSHRCVIAPGKTGFCRSRVNGGDGKLYAVNYAQAAAINIDPVEKKPLYHFMPGSRIVSTGSNFCNFSCRFCQNFEISQAKTYTQTVTAEKLLALIEGEAACGAIAFTYNEPVVWYEFVYDVFVFIKSRSYKTVLVTNGDMSAEAFSELAPYIDAMNIDLKAFDKKFYSEICSGSFDYVCSTIESAYRRGIIVEITNLLIPGLNDSNRHIEDLVDFIASISSDIPLHFSRYHPAYLMNYPPTPLSVLTRAREMAVKKLKYVYIGNVLDPECSATYCPACKKALIHRSNYCCDSSGVDKNGKCIFCSEKIYGIFR